MSFTKLSKLSGMAVVLATVAFTLIMAPPALAKDKGLIFGRLNDKVMGVSWQGSGKLIVVIGDNEKKKKDFKICENGYVAGEVDVGEVKLSVVENKKEKIKEKRESFLNQPVLHVVKDRATYWGDVKIGYDYGSLTFDSKDNLEAAKTATIECLTEMGNEKLAKKLQAAPVDKQFPFVGMTDR